MVPHNMPQEQHHKELHLDSRLDQSIDISLRRVVYGTLAGGALAVLLFSKPCKVPDAVTFRTPSPAERSSLCCSAGGSAARAAAIGFGAGTGAGSAYTECQREVGTSLLTSLQHTGSQPADRQVTRKQCSATAENKCVYAGVVSLLSCPQLAGCLHPCQMSQCTADCVNCCS